MHSWALEKIEEAIKNRNEPDKELLRDYMAQLLGYMNNKQAAASGVHIVVTRTLQH
jgi:hypothetical protein